MPVGYSEGVVAATTPPSTFRWVSGLVLWVLLAVPYTSPSAAQSRDPAGVLLPYSAAGPAPALRSVDADVRARLQAGDEPSGWARYRWELIVGSGLALAGALLVIAVLLQRTGRRRAGALLAERLTFESLLAELSAGLIHVVPSELDAAIARELRRLAEFLGVDRAALHEAHGGRLQAENNPGRGAAFTFALPGTIGAT
jgi:hypothetical protein